MPFYSHTLRPPTLPSPINPQSAFSPLTIVFIAILFGLIPAIIFTLLLTLSPHITNVLNDRCRYPNHHTSHDSHNLHKSPTARMQSTCSNLKTRLADLEKITHPLAEEVLALGEQNLDERIQRAEENLESLNDHVRRESEALEQAREDIELVSQWLKNSTSIANVALSKAEEASESARNAGFLANRVFARPLVQKMERGRGGEDFGDDLNYRLWLSGEGKGKEKMKEKENIEFRNPLDPSSADQWYVIEEGFMNDPLGTRPTRARPSSSVPRRENYAPRIHHQPKLDDWECLPRQKSYAAGRIPSSSCCNRSGGPGELRYRSRSVPGDFRYGGMRVPATETRRGHPQHQHHHRHLRPRPASIFLEHNMHGVRQGGPSGAFQRPPRASGWNRPWSKSHAKNHTHRRRDFTSTRRSIPPKNTEPDDSTNWEDCSSASDEICPSRGRSGTRQYGAVPRRFGQPYVTIPLRRLYTSVRAPRRFRAGTRWLRDPGFGLWDSEWDDLAWVFRREPPPVYPRGWRYRPRTRGFVFH